MTTRKGKRGLTHPYIMKANKNGAKKAVQSEHITLDLFTTFMYLPTSAQVKQKPPFCSLTVATDKGSVQVLKSRYLDLKGLTAYVKRAK